LTHLGLHHGTIDATLNINYKMVLSLADMRFPTSLSPRIPNSCIELDTYGGPMLGDTIGPSNLATIGSQ